MRENEGCLFLVISLLASKPVDKMCGSFYVLKVEDLKNKMLDKLEDFLVDFQKESVREGIINKELDEPNGVGDLSDSVRATSHLTASSQVNYPWFVANYVN